MAVPSRKKTAKKSSGSRIVALVILTLVITAIAGYFLFSPPKKKSASPQKAETSHDKPIVPRSMVPQDVVPLQPETAPPTQNKLSDYPPTTVLPDADKSGVNERGSGRLAIIIDDMGNSMSEARSLISINVPLTFAIIPGQRADTEVAAYAVAHRVETMIHIPMQSKGWPAQRLEENGLLVAMDENEIQERMSGFVLKFPGAVGVNNHMGSEFTEHEDKMAAVLQMLKKSNLFFVDSVTSPGSVGGKVAHRLGLRSARRNVFLDNEQNRSYIIGQLDQAVSLAKKNGAAIAICHPHPATIAALAAALPELAGKGITLVPASQLVK
ncbi:MAG: divergent polysaccharide deacetylase family protein [Desulfuromonadaceae bacterium]|nr:divergent polysaccharide deacetylase family protein [Desulfuromonadaceae bacterium]